MHQGDIFSDGFGNGALPKGFGKGGLPKGFGKGGFGKGQVAGGWRVRSSGGGVTKELCISSSKREQKQHRTG